jgi:hypothetical protein
MIAVRDIIENPSVVEAGSVEKNENGIAAPMLYGFRHGEQSASS